MITLTKEINQMTIYMIEELCRQNNWKLKIVYGFDNVYKGSWTDKVDELISIYSDCEYYSLEITVYSQEDENILNFMIQDEKITTDYNTKPEIPQLQFQNAILLADNAL